MSAECSVAACDSCQAALMHFHLLAAHCYYLGYQFGEHDMQVISWPSISDQTIPNHVCLRQPGLGVHCAQSNGLWACGD